MNTDLRRQIVDMVVRGRNGHIPSAFSILDLITALYANHLRFDASNPDADDRDYFILSKGHGCLALYVNLHRHGFVTDADIESFAQAGGRLGEHPDATKVPGVEASTGSLGHGLPIAVGLALGLRLQGKSNRVFVLVGDGECHEGTVWEAANVAANLRLGNLCVLVDWNGSASQLMPVDDLPGKWEAFGWNVAEIDGHSGAEIDKAINDVPFAVEGMPSVIVARTTKGRGVDFIEGHGMWHHRIPNDEEYARIMSALELA